MVRQMIKVCMVGYFYFNDTRVRRYVDTLIKAGIAVDILCLQGTDNQTPDKIKGFNLFTVPIPLLPKNLAGYALEYCLTFFLLSYQLLRLFIKNHYDVIHVHNMPDFLVFTAFIPKILGAKLLLDIHDPMPEVYMSKFGKRNKTTMGVRLIRLEEKISTMFADAVITANVNFKRNLVKRGVPDSKVTVINNFPNMNIFDRSKYSRESNHKNYTLIYPGTIEPRYGLEVAIKALPLIKKRINNIRLLILGRPRKHLYSLITMAEELGISSIVEFKMAIPIQEVPKQLVDADIGIYPAIPDPHMSIATPTKVLEYAAMGLPIISSRLQIIEDLFTDSSILFFEPGNVEQFAECVINLYQDPLLADKLVKNAAQILKINYSWKHEQQTYLYLIDCLLHKDKRN